MRTLPAVLCLAAAATIPALAHLAADLSAEARRAEAEAQSAKAAQPTFKVSVNVVDVDVTVKDQQGHFVTGLTADDFDVFEDGKPQTIQTFSYIELPMQRRTSFTFEGRPVAADVRSNRDVESGRVYIILLDDLNVAPIRTAIVRRRAREFIEQHFGPRDLAAVVVTSGRNDAAQEFTNDPALLLRAVDHFFGQRLQSAEMQRIDDYYTNQLLAGANETVSRDNDPAQQTTVLNPVTRNQSFDPSNLERGQRAVGVLNTIESLSEFLEGVRGRRKALLWFSEGIDYPMADVFSSQSGNEILRATRDAVNAAARANVNVYSLDPRGLIGMTTDLIDSMKAGAPDAMGTDPSKPVGTPFSGTQALLSEMRLTRDSLRTLAEGTGGFAATDTNSFVEAYERITDANSRYYLLGYARPAHPRDGRFHRIEVRTKRPGLTVVARRGYPSPSGKTATERKQDALERWARDRRSGGANDTSPELRAALNSAVQQPGLTLSVQAAPFKGAAKDASVALTVELDGIPLEFAQQPNGLLADTLEVSFFALNEDSRAQRGTRAALNLAIRPETYQRVKTQGVRLNSRTTLAPGRYQLRVGARNPVSGRSGTVFYDVVVPDFTREPLMMSGLLLSSISPAASEMLTPQRDPVAEKLLGTPATTRRTFTQMETLAWMTEIYDNARKQSGTIDVSVRLLDEAGREAFGSRDLLKNGEAGAAAWQTFGYTGRIPLKDIPPGRYLLRVEALDRSTPSRQPVAADTVITVR
jgi:VWFA-related protein